MSDSSSDDALATEFQRQRDRLAGVAYRVLGSRADAEDAVQEAWLRLARQDAASIDNLAGWLTTVVSRVCIDMLRSRAAKRESELDESAPEWVVTEDDPSSPERNAVLADSVGAALLVVLDALTPDERIAFVLHDTFGVPFAEIGDILGKSADAAKMLASRARGKVRGAEHPRDVARQREVVDAFMAAAQHGDFERLMALLHPDVTWRLHTPRGVVVHTGASELAAQAARGTRSKTTWRRALVDGRVGIVAWRANGAPLTVMACTVVDGVIVDVESVTDPERLAAMKVPALAE